MIFVFFCPIKRAEFAINVADIGVVNVSIDNVSHDLVSLAVVGQALRLLSPFISQGTKLFERPAVKLQRVIGRNPFACENLFYQRISI